MVKTQYDPGSKSAIHQTEQDPDFVWKLAQIDNIDGLSKELRLIGV